jgi:hypothetical protein
MRICDDVQRNHHGIYEHANDDVREEGGAWTSKCNRLPYYQYTPSSHPVKKMRYRADTQEDTSAQRSSQC